MLKYVCSVAKLIAVPIGITSESFQLSREGLVMAAGKR